MENQIVGFNAFVMLYAYHEPQKSGSMCSKMIRVARPKISQ